MSNVYRTFQEMLQPLEDDDYERCEAQARAFLSRPDLDREEEHYRPYAGYFRLFAQAYRDWQISYHYTKIRSRFQMAHDILARDLAEGHPDDPCHALLGKAFGLLSDMLCAYTWCENSFINNDPAALARHSAEALAQEESGLGLLAEFRVGEAKAFALLKDCLEGLENPRSELEAVRGAVAKSLELILDGEERAELGKVAKMLAAPQPNRAEAAGAIERILSAFHLPDVFAQWLADYFQTNQYLHTGLNACAQIYQRIFEDHHCPGDFYCENMARAREALKLLAAQTEELASELNAHIVHVSRHWERLQAQPTLLRVRHGKLVLALEAACNRGVMQAILKDPDDFWHRLSGRFEHFHIEATGFRADHLHDIFETSFGENFLQAASFDLPAVRLSYSDERSYLFQTHVTLSSLGVCTIFFTLPLEDQPDGLGVEEIRMLQSCICPHAGQVRVLLEDPEGSDRASLRLFRLAEHQADSDIIDRMDLASLKRKVGEIRALLEDPRLKRHAAGIHETLEDLVNCWCRPGPKNREKQAGKTCVVNDDSPRFDHSLRELVRELGALAGDGTAPAGARRTAQAMIQALVEPCDLYTSLIDLARLFLDRIGDEFKETAAKPRPGNAKKNQATPDNQKHLWILRKDTGWFTYLYATGIDEVPMDGAPARERVSFESIARHPDMLGLIIEQREARASFDDWRFMDFRYDKEPNLAGVRSHDTDAFFISEYQSFFYFPDDPQFLTDQYEATVELMNRLNEALRFYNQIAQDLSQKVMDQLDKFKTGEIGREQARALRESLDAIRRYRAEANEIQNLIFKADVSRYKDHGDLMNQIIQKMKLDKICQLLSRHLDHLDDLHSYIIRGLEEKQARKFQKRIALVSSLLGATAIGGVIGALFKTDPVTNFFKNNPSYFSKEGVEGLITLSIIIFVFGWMFYLQTRKDD